MRHDTRVILALLVVYVPLALLVGWGLDRSLALSSQRLLEGNARAVVRELAATLDDALIADLFAEDPPSTEVRQRRVQELLGSEDSVVGIEAVAPDGEILAASNTARIGHRKTALESRFPEAGGAESALSGIAIEQGHRPRIAVRVAREGQPVGYVDVTLDLSEQVLPFRNARRRILLVLALSLAAVGLLALLLHLQAVRAERDLIRSMEDAATGRFSATAGSPQFSRALAAVGRLGEELRTERDRTRRLASLAEFIDVGVLVVDCDGEVELVSERCRRLLSVDPEASDSDDFRLVSWLSLKEQLKSTMKLLATRPAGASHEVVVELEGEPPRRSRQIQVVALEPGEGFLCLVRDRDMLESLKTDLRLAAYLRGLTRLYMGIAHDLKGPLNAVNLHLEVLRRTALRGAQDEQAEAAIEQPVGIIRSELERLRSMIESLLSQTAPPSDRLERFDLAELVREIAAMLSPQARRQGVLVGVDAAGAPLWMRFHRDQLKQAILNVAINGLEVLDHGGSLRLDARRQADRLQVRIKDTGPGIDPEIRDRLFEMHVTTKESGTGIGLWVVRNTLEARGGSIEVESSGPEGTTFLLEIPDNGGEPVVARVRGSAGEPTGPVGG
ncbi:MAG TPA: HAMP domain-containing sensor histidine kinase [Thermoanaerobaculia bacterium]|nr:HAMP domain-containing sensor histidine kinase [Thermoanaerobaculia bacterium]